MHKWFTVTLEIGERTYSYFRKHMMTNYKGGILDSALGNTGVLSHSHFLNPHCFDGHAYVKVYTLY